MEYPCWWPVPVHRRPHTEKEGRHASYGVLRILSGPTATLMDYIVACPDRALLEALCAFVDHLHAARSARPARRAPRPVRAPGHAAGGPGRGANSLAAVAAFTHDHLAWFRLWLPLGIATPSRDTYLRLVRGWTSRRP